MVMMVLLWVGGLNWGLVGLLNVNLVEMLVGSGMLANLVYVLVGLSAVYAVLTHAGTCTVCGKK